MVAELPVRDAVSAGGVVYRYRGDTLEVVLCGRRDPPLWSLPKGTPNPGESLVETARREVEEETGLRVRAIKGRVGLTRYWFIRDGVRYHKTVHFYLMEAEGGSLENHDPEFDVVEWLPIAEAYRRLTFENDARIVRRAISMVKNGQGAKISA